VLRDIDDQQCATNEPRESEERYRRLVELANDAILVIDSESGKLLYTNSQLEALAGRSRDELIGRHFTSLYPERYRASHEALFREMVGKGGFISNTLCLQRRDGQLVPVEISANVLELRNRCVLQQIVRDISGRSPAGVKQ